MSRILCCLICISIKPTRRIWRFLEPSTFAASFLQMLQSNVRNLLRRLVRINLGNNFNRWLKSRFSPRCKNRLMEGSQALHIQHSMAVVAANQNTTRIKHHHSNTVNTLKVAMEISAQLLNKLTRMPLR